MADRMQQIELNDKTTLTLEHIPIWGDYGESYEGISPGGVMLKLLDVAEPTLVQLIEAEHLAWPRFSSGVVLLPQPREGVKLLGYDTQFDGEGQSNPHMRPLWTVGFDHAVRVIGVSSHLEDGPITGIMLGEGILSISRREATVLALDTVTGTYLSSGLNFPEAYRGAEALQ